MKKKIFIFILIMSSVIIFGDETKWIEDYAGKSLQELKKIESDLLVLDDGYEKYAQLGLVYHFQCNNGERKAKTAIHYLEKALEIKKNHIINAYLGSAYTILGGESESVKDKIDYVNKGIEIMDKEYNDHPNDYAIAVLIISNSLELPDIIFHRYKTASDILEKLEAGIKKYDRSKQATILFLKGYALFKKGKKREALNIWQDITLKYSGTNASNDAEKLIEEYGE